MDSLKAKHDEVLQEFLQLSPNAKAFNPSSIYQFYKDGDVLNFEKSLNLIKQTNNKDMLNSVKMLVADDIYATIKPSSYGTAIAVRKSEHSPGMQVLSAVLPSALIARLL